MKYLVTGGCGFIGSNFIHRMLEKHPKIQIINIDSMTTGSNLQNFKGFKNKNYSFVKGNICNKTLMKKLIKKVDYVINFAAESHVDRSISDSEKFFRSNVFGVYNILEILREEKARFLQISTDEVYGESLKKPFLENDELNPSNPYSATKAAAEMLVRSYVRTYGIDAKITRCTNNFGPRQYPEKIIPKTIISAMKNQQVPIHGKGLAKRQWIHVFDHCDAIEKIINLDAKMIYRLDRFGRGGHHRPFNDEGFAGVRIMEAHEDYTMQHQDIRFEDGIHYGDVIGGVDFDFAAKLTAVNAIVLAGIAWAPPPIPFVSIGGAVQASTRLKWDPVEDPDLMGYKVYWRETTESQWQFSKFVGMDTDATLKNIIIDNFLFGVSTVSTNGNESVVTYPKTLIPRTR